MVQFRDKSKIISLKETTSTNQYLKKMLSENNPAEGTVVVADFQTNGRGQAGNSWYAEEGENLLFSLLIYPVHIAANRQFIISKMISLALLQTLKSYVDEVKIKWPNDIYLNNRKAAGILIENSLQGKTISSSIVGVGLNINQIVFPDHLPNPISLRQITAAKHDQMEILEQIYNCFFQYYDQMKNDNTSIDAAYLQNLFQLNQSCKYKDEKGIFTAEIVDVLSTGHLVMKTFPENERRVYAFKEVEFLFDNEK